VTLTQSRLVLIPYGNRCVNMQSQLANQERNSGGSSPVVANVVTGERLEKLREPGKPLQTGVVKALDIVEGRETIVAVVSQGHIRCNKMQSIGKTDRFNCSMLGAPVSKEYCLEKCIVADQLKKILDKTG